MAQMLDLQQQYLQNVGQFFNSGPTSTENSFDQWWKQFPKTGQFEFDDVFKNLSRAGMDMMQNPFANLQQPFLASQPGMDWFTQMGDQFQSWIKSAAPGQSVFAQMNEQLRQQLVTPFNMDFLPKIDNPFANLNPAAGLNSPILQLLQNLYAPGEKAAGEQLLETLKMYQQQIMEMNSLIAQVGIDSLAELQKNIAGQEALSVQALYESWMDISKKVFDELQLTETYQKIVDEMTAAGEQLREDFEAYQQALTEQLGLVKREAYDELRDEVETLRAQVSQLMSDKASKPSQTVEDIVDDFTVLKGIGAKFNEKLHQQGVKTMSQLAAMNDEMLKNLDETLQSKGKVFEQQWREQAEKVLAAMSAKK